MEATQAQFLNLLDGKKQFTIPIYQRPYSWQNKQCQQLFDDIVRVGSDENEISHFIGSVVYFKACNSPVTSIPELLVIDGQQRLTTISLLLLALIHFLKESEEISLVDESWEEVLETYVINKHRKDESKFKLLLTRKDKSTFTKLVEEMDVDGDYSKRIYDNYHFFKNRINEKNVQTVYNGIKKLIIVDVSLERDKDNPQLIFESLNSTGLDLSQADLIRNFILMDQSIDSQKELYERHWYVMEQNFGDNIDSLALFIRDYLTMKKGSIPKIDQVYEVFKSYLKSVGDVHSVEEVVKSLHRYSKYYARIALLQETDLQILKKFKEISKLKVDTSYPFLLAVYGDYEAGLITKDDFLEIISLVVSYVFRRVVCGIATNSLNKTFATLYRRIKPETYLESVQAEFVLMDSFRRFPTDAEFINELQVKDVYNLKIRNYLLESLENWNRKECINTDNYTIEHILPQNPNLSVEWQVEIGEDLELIREKYLHTIGNLTLTGYNSELSDRPFHEKKSIPGGFNSSPLHLNETVRELEHWNEHSILKRASKLSQRACEIWKKPALPTELIEKYREPKDDKNSSLYNLESYEHLHGEMLTLYENLEKRILNLYGAIRIEFKKLYIAFKVQTNFVDIIPQKKRLRLSLNVPFETIKDPRGLCKDVSGLARWGNGEVEIAVANLSDVDYAMHLIEQALDEQLELA